MANITTKAILDRARDFHEQVAVLYERMHTIATRERVRMLLSYLIRHEHDMARSIKEYEASAEKGILDTWFKVTPSGAGLACMDDIKIHPDMTVEDVMRIGNQLDDCLLKLYQGSAEAAVSTQVKELFDQLCSLERKEESQLSKLGAEMEQV